MVGNSYKEWEVRIREKGRGTVEEIIYKRACKNDPNLDGNGMEFLRYISPYRSPDINCR